MYSEWFWVLIPILGVPFLLLCLSSSWLCMQLAALTLFLGVLTSFPVGFTLKAPQVFTLLGLLAYLLEWSRGRSQKSFPWLWASPFILCLFSFLPAFYSLDRQAWMASDSSIRLLLNYVWLQLFTLLLLLSVQTQARIVRLVNCGLLSFAASLVFGLGQQIAFYVGRYNPYAHVGTHSSIVDFYGPFLRLSPGTFANEYGEILQTVGMWLIALAFWVPGVRRWRWWLPLAFVMTALVLNFTRASWLVFAAGGFTLLVLSGLKLGALVVIALLGSISLALLWWLSQWLLAASVLLTVSQRFQELNQVQSFSAGQRLETWGLAWNTFLNSPWFGSGWGQYIETHNVPLQLLAEVGILGFCGFYGLMAWVIWENYRAWSWATTPLEHAWQMTFLLSLIGCLAFDLTNHGIAHFVLWFVLGLSLAQAYVIRRNRCCI